MPATPVIAVFDIGKTNKKLFLFDEDYKILFEDSVCLEETTDEDGDPCENLEALKAFVFSSLEKVLANKKFAVKALNFSAYGASFVYIDRNGKPLTPLYNYLKPYPQLLQMKLHQAYGGAEIFASETASPVLGSLNSGLQLYRLKQEQPTLFQNIAYAFHLPQYLSYLFADYPATDITSIGCHTALWNFEKNSYHRWVIEENLELRFAPMLPTSAVVSFTYRGKECMTGFGLHDSSAAMIPYLASFQEPFVLISTGTWCISLNPFNETPLSYEELQQDCLCYLTYEGRPVKASRLFTGHEHEQGIKQLTQHFGKPADYYKTIYFQPELLREEDDKQAPFAALNLSLFPSYEQAYHRLVEHLVQQQKKSTQLVLKGSAAKRIFVDGGFSKNPIYMHSLAAAFPKMEVFAASMAQATALGAALAVHESWNSKRLPTDIIELKHYGTAQDVS